jgi:hypothetical protein
LTIRERLATVRGTTTPGEKPMKGLAIFGTLLIALPAEAGVRLVSETVDPRGASGEQRIELQGDKLRVERFSQEGTGAGGVGRVPGATMIFDGSQMFSLDHRTKTYVVIRPNFDKATKQADDASRFAFKKSSGGDTVAGFRCSNYSQLQNGVERGTVCIASWKAGPVKKEDVVAILKFAQTMGVAEASKTAILVNPDDWPGFPVSSRSAEGQILRLKSAARMAIPDSEFQPPADYVRKAMP